MSLFNPCVTCISTQRPKHGWPQCSYSLRIFSPEGEGVVKDVNHINNENMMWSYIIL